MGPERSSLTSSRAAAIESSASMSPWEVRRGVVDMQSFRVVWTAPRWVAAPMRRDRFSSAELVPLLP